MNTITNTYEIPPASGGAPTSMVIFLHGLGSNGRDLISIGNVWAHALPETVFLSPDAPYPCDMVPPGYPDAYQWFSLQNRDPHAMKTGAEAAAPVLEAFIAEQLTRFKVPPARLALVGFSQGTMMSLYLAPRLKDAIAGVVGYSGALLGGEGLSAPNTQHIPVHLVHGAMDDVVPVEAYHMARDVLMVQGFTVTGHVVPFLPHTIDQTGLDSGLSFLQGVLR